MEPTSFCAMVRMDYIFILRDQKITMRIKRSVAGPVGGAVRGR